MEGVLKGGASTRGPVTHKLESEWLAFRWERGQLRAWDRFNVLTCCGSMCGYLKGFYFYRRQVQYDFLQIMEIVDVFVAFFGLWDELLEKTEQDLVREGSACC